MAYVLTNAWVLAAAIQLVLEEVLLSDVHMHPYELLGWEGVFGTAFMAVALPVLHVLPGAIDSLGSFIVLIVDCGPPVETSECAVIDLCIAQAQ